MIEIGKKTALLVADETKSGFTLQSDDGDEVFLPGSMAPKTSQLANPSSFLSIRTLRGVEWQPQKSRLLK